MYQKFFEDTIISRFIKRLLRSSSIPLPSKKGEYNYHSNVAYYDPDTHYHLGEYLRKLRDNNYQNLMPFYNCFNYQVVDGFTFTSDGTEYVIEERTSSDYKYLAVPVKFGKTYTVALQSNLAFYYGFVFYGEYGLVNAFNKSRAYSSIKHRTESRFNDLWTIEVPPVAENSSEKSFESILYLVFQLPSSNNSSLVVLEGDYTCSSPSSNGFLPKFSYTEEMFDDQPDIALNLELLRYNDGKSYPFSDKLIEYLLLNVIDKNDEIIYNSNIINENNLDGYVAPSIPGVFSPENRFSILKKLKELVENHEVDVYDIDGNIDSKVEYLIQNGYLKPTTTIEGGQE